MLLVSGVLVLTGEVYHNIDANIKEGGYKSLCQLFSLRYGYVILVSEVLVLIGVIDHNIDVQFPLSTF